MHDNLIAPNTLEKKLYQTIISRLDTDGIHKDAYRKKVFSLIKKGIGGFIIFGGGSEPQRGAESPGEIRRFISEMQSASDIPLFIASDIERGVGQQIKGASAFPCQMAVSAAINKNKPKDIRILKHALTAIGEEAKDIGINMPLIPVMDVNQNPDNPIISTRAFSDNPKDVSWFGIKFINILQGMGLICSAKHFPGHGDTSIDSHIQVPVIKKSYRDLMKTDIFPFRSAIKAGVKSIMVGHLSVPAIDLKPSSLSRKIITGLLREKLGFKGLVLTDALNMGAIRDMKDVSLECIKAGADILLHPPDANHTVKELMRAIKEKRLDVSEIDVSVSRILRVKGGCEVSRTPAEWVATPCPLSSYITQMSITLIKKRGITLPIPKKTPLIFAGDSESFETSPLRDYFRVIDLSGISTTDDIGYKTVIFAIFTSIKAWKGISGISNEERKLISKLMRKVKNSIVISFGSPYVLRDFGKADMLVAAYEATEQAQMAVIRCLKGEMDFKGRLPIHAV